MGAQILSLIPNNSLCMDQESLAAALDRCAARVRSGEFVALERIIVLYEASGKVYPNTYGRQCTSAELVGLLEYAKREVIG